MSVQFINLFLQKKLQYHYKNADIKSQRINFKERVIALAIALLTLPLFAPKSSAENWLFGVSASHHVISQTTQPAGMAYVSKRQPPIHLWLETGAGALLLMGLIAAYIANRTQKPRTLAATDAKKMYHIPDAANMALAPASVTSLLPQSSAAEETAIERAELIQEIMLRLQQSLDIEDLLRTTTKEVRRVLKTDRVLVYGFNRDTWQGDVIAESVGVGLPQTLRVKIDDPCLRDRHVEDYKKGRIRAINDITSEPGLTQCHRRLLDQFAVKANLVAPILQNDELFGLLIAHQCDRPREWQPEEIHLFSQLSQQVSFVMHHVTFLENQQAEAEQTQLIQETSFRWRQALDTEDLFKTAVKDIRRAIRTDRVIICQLDITTAKGKVVAEAVSAGLPQTLRINIEDPCFQKRQAELYRNGRVRAIGDIYQEPGLADCYIKLLEQFAVKANLVAPILQNDELFGLLIAHQCDRPRIWQQNEISLFSRLATQVGFAMSQIVI